MVGDLHSTGQSSYKVPNRSYLIVYLSLPPLYFSNKKFIGFLCNSVILLLSLRRENTKQMDFKVQFLILDT